MRNESLSEFGKVLRLAGFRDVRIECTESLLNTLRERNPSLHIQLLNANRIAGIDHLRSAVLNALQAFVSEENISESLAVEILLYASGQRQIRAAIELLGATKKTTKLAILAVADNDQLMNQFETDVRSQISGIADDSVLEEWNPEEMMKLFNIVHNEVQAMKKEGEQVKEVVRKLVLERVAIISTLI